MAQPTMEDIAKIKAAWDRDIAEWQAKVEAMRGALTLAADQAENIARIMRNCGWDGHQNVAGIAEGIRAALASSTPENVKGGVDPKLDTPAEESSSKPSMDPEFAEELRERLLSLAEDADLKRRHTHFRGEIKAFASIVRIAANVLGRPAAPAEGTIAATQVSIGRGLADIGEYAFDGRRGVLIRPRPNHIPLGEPGELQDTIYWTVPGDVVLWVDGPPDVLIEMLTSAVPAADPAEARSEQAEAKP